MAPAYFITTLGCPKNQADSREMERSLLARGFSQASTAEEADVHIINTCSFILDAREETIDNVFEAADVKDRKVGGQKLVLTGCFSQRYPDAVREEIPEVDLAFGVGEFDRAAEKIQTLFPGSGELPRLEKQPLSITPPYAPVKVSDGCSRSCAFCAIPQIRGPYRSLNRDEILAEVERLVQEGVREIDIVSQDTGYYGQSPEELVDLLKSIEAIGGVTWIRLLYLYPDEKTRKILRGIREMGLEKVVPYLESPIQHVSERILKGMGRQGNRKWFEEFFQEARDLFPGLEIRTTILLGFPGETEEDVEEVLAFVENVKPEKLALFTYSPEEGTPAFEKFGEEVEPGVASRINRIRGAHLEVLKQVHADRIGRVYRCMVDGVDAEGIVVHRAQDAPEADEIVHIPFREGLGTGDLVSVEITGFYEYDMIGEIR